MYVGIDDTDSVDGMCTTYISSVIIDELKYFGFNIIGYPRLVRLNPFIKFKTRGNGAISFKLNVKGYEEVQKVKDIVLKKIEELSMLNDEKTNPGVVFYCGEIIDSIQSYSLNVIRNIITIDEAEEFAKNIGAEFFKFKKGRGIIGALAAIGCPDNDKTYELLAYRMPENYGKKRLIDQISVFKMNNSTYPDTFDNVDGDNGYIAIEPHTPCPILYGIRGESPEAVLNAHKMIEVGEPIEKIAVFKTNQHTDMHLVKADDISKMEKYKCYVIDGTVKNYPFTFEGGHVIFILSDRSGEIHCAAYEPTKEFRDIIRKLAPGDKLRVYGGIGERGTLNIEKINIIELAKIKKTENPLCGCGKRMKSAGSGKGYKCVKCGTKLREGAKDSVEIERNLKTGFYEVPPSARRHLSKPIVRMNR
ncbi:MAG: tRNA(Ile)(2)-agmatinylcytidine synthase [Methanobacteriaceae archaeon]|jgi:tRNA(Ile2)-agmatinylcytidine synthase